MRFTPAGLWTLTLDETPSTGQEAWNMRGAKGSASFYTEDATRVGAFGDVQHGRAEI